MSALTIGSLFSGIGGLELGLERGIGNGAHTIWQVEQSEYCRAVLAKHWPDATRYDDVRTVGRATLAPVDVICGGFPCQDISMAGGRAGIREGTRSGLWYEYARIIGELRPRYVVVENVAALLTSGLDVVLGELAALGYDAWWDCLPASSVGAPHRRDRLFLLAYPGCGGIRSHGGHRQERGSAGAAEGDRGERQRLRHTASRRGEDVAHSSHVANEQASARPCALGEKWNARHDARGGGGPQRPVADWWASEPSVGRVAHGISSRVDRLRALGNAVVPQVAEVVGRLIAEREALEVAA